MKLIDLLKELEINNPAITPKKVFQLYKEMIDKYFGKGLGFINFTEDIFDKYLNNGWKRGLLKQLQLQSNKNCYMIYKELESLDQKLRHQIHNNINELEVNSPVKLKAYKNPSDAIYLLFNGNGENSTLNNYSMSVGWFDKKHNQVEFEKAPHNVEKFKQYLNKLNIPYTYGADELIICIPSNLFNIKSIDKWSLYDEDVKGWYNKVIL